MAEPGGEQSSRTPHGLLPELDCSGNLTTPDSEVSAVMDMRIKTEPVEQDMSQPAYCTEIQGFSAKELGSGLHLCVDQIKQESVLLNIKQESDDGELCSTTEMICFPSEQLNSGTCLLAKQCRSQTGEVMAEQTSLLQEPSVSNTEMHGAAFYPIKEKHEVIEGYQLSFSPLTEQHKQETDAVKSEQNSLPNDLSQKSLVEPNSSSAAEGALEQSMRPGTSVINHKTSKQPFHDSVIAEAQNCKIKFQCIRYGKSFSQVSTLKKHQVVHSREKLFGCDKCPKSFSHAQHLKKHQVVHSGEKPYICHLCGKRFSNRSILKKHHHVHSGEKPYECSHCGKSFSDSANLRNHQVFHFGEKSYKCSQCEKSFFYQSALKKHQVVHSSEKPFGCDKCPKYFSHAEYLKQHQVVHSPEKQFVCSECSKSFSRAGALKKHQIVHSHEKPFGCEKCPKSFSRASHLKQHLVVHSHEKPFGCDKCPKSFSRAEHLKKHQVVHSHEEPFGCGKRPKSFSSAGDLKKDQEWPQPLDADGQVAAPFVAKLDDTYESPL
ncbi:zinc finger protein 134-like [Scleropages formosus]|uniref:zinc finger protein 134-like n=1 Tax=Scleropages formosus TaxID=113540 RepID=UPI0010FA8D9B|nr:zinc finger protein 134-like [Scleropages formosus]